MESSAFKFASDEEKKEEWHRVENRIVRSIYGNNEFIPGEQWPFRAISLDEITVLVRKFGYQHFKHCAKDGVNRTVYYKSLYRELRYQFEEFLGLQSQLGIVMPLGDFAEVTHVFGGGLDRKVEVEIRRAVGLYERCDLDLNKRKNCYSSNRALVKFRVEDPQPDI
jgi:hypothetical protein